MWQLSWLSMSANETSKMLASTPGYRQQDEKIRRLADELRKSPDYEEFRRAQMRLWKTPEYRSVHRRYSGRLQDINRAYGGAASGSY